MTLCVFSPRAKMLLVIALALNVWSCPAGSAFDPSPPPSSDEAIVYLYRKSRILGAADRLGIVVNGKSIATLGNGEYTSTRVGAGKIAIDRRWTSRTFLVVTTVTPERKTVTRTNRSVDVMYEEPRAVARVPTFEMTVSAGGTYYVEWTFSGLMIRSASEAKAVVEDCKQATTWPPFRSKEEFAEFNQQIYGWDIAAVFLELARRGTMVGRTR